MSKKSKSKTQKFVGTVDAHGGLIIPDEAVRQLKGSISLDGVQYPFVRYGGKKYVVIKTAQGWTIGGKVAERQHAKNVAELNARPRLARMRRKAVR